MHAQLTSITHAHTKARYESSVYNYAKQDRMTEANEMSTSFYVLYLFFVLYIFLFFFFESKVVRLVRNRMEKSPMTFIEDVMTTTMIMMMTK